MAYNEALVDRVRRSLTGSEGVDERKMFGGLCFMLHGNMILGVAKDDLMARVGPDGHDAALAQPGARPMDFTGRPMRGFVYVGPMGYETDQALADWVARAFAFVGTLPCKGR